MSKGHDATDLLCYSWAATRRQLLGLTNPRTQREFVGAIRSTLGNVQRHHDGAGSFTAREQHFPEVYEGDALLVNLAFKRMPPQLAPYMDLHYTLGRGAVRRADLLGIGRSKYWESVKRCKMFVEGYFVIAGDRAA